MSRLSITRVSQKDGQKRLKLGLYNFRRTVAYGVISRNPSRNSHGLSAIGSVKQKKGGKTSHFLALNVKVKIRSKVTINN